MKYLLIFITIVFGIIVIFPWLLKGLMWMLQRKLRKKFEQGDMFGAFGQQQQYRRDEDVVFEDAEVTVLEGDSRSSEPGDSPAKKHSGDIRDANFRDA